MGCASSRNPAAVGAVYQAGEGRAVRSVRGAPRSAEVCLRRSHIGILEEPSRLPVPHREDLSRHVRQCSVLKTSALNSVRWGEIPEQRRLAFTLLESSENIEQRGNFSINFSKKALRKSGSQHVP